MRSMMFLAAVLMLALGLGAGVPPALAVDSEITTLGGACTGTQNAADWDTLFQCVGNVWQRSAYLFGNSSSTCDANHAGLARYNAGALQVCNGLIWTGLAGLAGPGAEGQVQFNSSGSLGADGTLTWDNTNKRLGIGTAAPGALVEISGSYWDNSTGGDLRVTSSNATATGITLKSTAAGGRPYSLISTGPIASIGAGGFGVFSNSSHAYRLGIKSSGFIGINSAYPQATLDVNGTLRLAANAAAPVACGAAYAGAVAYTSTTNYLCFCDGAGPTWKQAHSQATDCIW